MAWLAAEESHGQLSLRCVAANGPGFTVHAAGHVHRYHAAGGAQGFRGHTIHIARQPGAVDGIDHQGRAARGPRTETRRGAAPTRSGRRRIRAPLGGAGGGQRDGPPGLCQQSRHDIAITAIIAGAAQYQRAARTDPGAHGTCDGAAGVFHQRHAADAAINRHPIRFTHLFGRQQFKHSRFSPKAGWRFAPSC